MLCLNNSIPSLNRYISVIEWRRFKTKPFVGYGNRSFYSFIFSSCSTQFTHALCFCMFKVVLIRQFHHLKPNLSPKYAAQRIQVGWPNMTPFFFTFFVSRITLSRNMQAFYRKRQDEWANQSIFLKKRLLATLKIQRLVRAFLLGSSAKRFLVRHKSAIIIQVHRTLLQLVLSMLMTLVRSLKQKHFRKFIVCKQLPIIVDRLEIYSLRRRLAALERAFENFIVQKDELFVKRQSIHLDN